MRVSAPRIAIVAAVIAGVYLAVLFSVRRVPDAALAVLGGPTGVARDGGLVVRYRLPATYDTARLERSIERRGASVRRDGAVLVVEVPGVRDVDADRVAALLTHGGLEFREVLEDGSLTTVPHETHDRENYVAPGVRVSIDLWTAEPDGMRRSMAYLAADNPELLAEAFATLRARGWAQPPHSVVAFERVTPWPGDKVQRVQWRSYLLGDEVLLDGDAVVHAWVGYNAITDAPMVMIELDRRGAQQLGEITERVVGRKLAVVVGGQVQSAPVIQSAIRGGHAQISMGHGDRVTQDRDAEALVAALTTVSLPQGGAIEDQRWVPPADSAIFVGLARLLIGLVGGALVGGIVWLAVRVARPVWHRPALRPGGRFPVRRLLVTLLAPIALLVLGEVTLPGIDRTELYHLVAMHRAPRLLSMVDLGLAPIIAGYLVVELATLIVPSWRRRRGDPAARIAIGRWVAIVGIVLAVVQSYLAVRSLAELQGRAPVELIAPGMAPFAAAMASLVAGTLLLVIIAGVIRQHGLGNGYGALIVSGWLVAAARHFVAGAGSGSGFQLGAVTLVAIGCATAALLRMRIGEDREAPLRLPSSGQLPILAAIVVAAALALVGLHGPPLGWSTLAADGPWSVVRLGPDAGPLGPGWWLIAAIAVLIPAWSLALSRPAILAPLAARTQLTPPAPTSWRRATLLSFELLVLIAAAWLAAVLADRSAEILGDAILAMLATAVGLDMLDDLQARRADLVAVWPLHQAQHAELVRRVIDDAGIECHLQSSHLRTLLGPLGPFVPIDVLVPAASADDARARIAQVLNGPTA